MLLTSAAAGRVADSALFWLLPLLPRLTSTVSTTQPGPCCGLFWSPDPDAHILRFGEKSGSPAAELSSSSGRLPQRNKVLSGRHDVVDALGKCM
jgi:hypothetical protein